VLWDTRVWASLRGKGKMGSSRVFRLKLWWDHMATGSERSRGLQAKLTRAEVRVAAEHEDTAIADGERVEMLRKELAASQKCGQCGQCGAPVQTQWHVLGECQNPALVGVRRSVAGDLQEKTRKLLMAMPRARQPEGWEEWFGCSREGRWQRTGAERQDAGEETGWRTGNWLGQLHREVLDDWWRRLQVATATQWQRMVSLLQDLGWAAIAGCQEVWRAACRLRADEDEERADEEMPGGLARSVSVLDRNVSSGSQKK
jgi:hypothetical protein